MAILIYLALVVIQSVIILTYNICQNTYNLITNVKINQFKFDVKFFIWLFFTNLIKFSLIVIITSIIYNIKDLQLIMTSNDWYVKLNTFIQLKLFCANLIFKSILMNLNKYIQSYILQYIQPYIEQYIQPYLGSDFFVTKYIIFDMTISLCLLLFSGLYYVNIQLNVHNYLKLYSDHENLKKCYDKLQTRYDKLEISYDKLCEKYDNLQSLNEELNINSDEIESNNEKLMKNFEKLQISYDELYVAYQNLFAINDQSIINQSNNDQSTQSNQQIQSDLTKQMKKMKKQLMEIIMNTISKESEEFEIKNSDIKYFALNLKRSISNAVDKMI